MSAKTKEAKEVLLLDVPCEFGGVSIGECTARLGVRISREQISLEEADDCLCGRRLECRVVLGHPEDAPGQQTLIEDADLCVAGSADVKRFGCSPDWITGGLTFSLQEIDVAELARFSKGRGRLAVCDIAEIPEDGEHKEPARAEPPGTLKAQGPWRAIRLERLFTGAVLKALLETGLGTLGELADYTASERRLTDIAGIGQAKAELIEQRMAQFWESNQDAAAEE